MTKFVGLGNVEECGRIGDRTVNFIPSEDAVIRRARNETSAGVHLGPSWVDRGCRSVESGIGVPDGARGRYRNRLSEGRPRARSPRPGCRWCYWRVPVPKAADGPVERDADSGYRIRFHFCPNCGTTLYWEGDRNPVVCGVAVGAFDTSAFPPPSDSIWKESMHPWLGLPPRMESAGALGPLYGRGGATVNGRLTKVAR